MKLKSFAINLTGSLASAIVAVLMADVSEGEAIIIALICFAYFDISNKVNNKK